MVQSVTLTAAMNANLLSLQQTGSQLDTAQLDLSTGNKVNSALDNPVNFFAAQSLNLRASSLSSLLDGMGQAVQTIQATNQGITAITSLVNQLTSIANSAKTDLDNKSTQDVLESQNGISSANVANLTNAVSSGDSFTLQDGSGLTHTFTIGASGVGNTLDDVVNAINQVQGFSASIVYGDGVTTYSANATGTDQDNALATDNTVSATTAAGSAYLKIVSTDNQVITVADGVDNGGSDPSVIGALGFVANAGNSDTTTASYTAYTSFAITTGGELGDQTSYKSVIAQIAQTVTDSNYQGNNLIDGSGNSLTVQVNEQSTGAITVENKNLTAAGLGLAADASSWTTTANIDSSITQINNALSTLQSTASGFANSLSLIQTRQDFTTNLVNTLQDGASQLTIADKNEEGADLLALQTQQQLGIEALSLSSQANQSVLRLFA